MSKYCPILNRKVVYLDCLECEAKECAKETKTGSNNVANVDEEISLKEYQEMAMNVCRIPYRNNRNMLYHSIIGLNSEAGEVAGILQKEYQGHEVKLNHLKRELGDCLWMLAEACNAIGSDLEEIARINIEKLKARFPDGFSSEKSIHRKEGDV